MEDTDADSIGKEVTVVRNATDLQRLKLEKLMKNLEKLAYVPDKPKDKKFSDPAEFVRNVMGSSAGAGSGEFHVYRHIRRREYARQDFLLELNEKEKLDRAYHEKVKENKLQVELKAAKKRSKRQKQKARQRAKRQKLKEMKSKGIPIKDSSSSSEDSSDEEDEVKEDSEVLNNKKVEIGKDTTKGSLDITEKVLEHSSDSMNQESPESSAKVLEEDTTSPRKEKDVILN